MRGNFVFQDLLRGVIIRNPLKTWRRSGGRLVGVKASARVPTRFLHVYHHSHLWTYRGVSMMLGGAASDTTAGSSRQATSSAPQHTAAAAATSGSTTKEWACTPPKCCMLTGSSATTCELRLGRGTTKAARAVTEARTRRACDLSTAGSCLPCYEANCRRSTTPGCSSSARKPPSPSPLR